MIKLSETPRLEAKKGDGGRLCLIGDLRGMPVSGGLLAVRRIGDDHWLIGTGRWSTGRPQWFPFGRDDGVSGKVRLEVQATALLDLIAEPPTESLSIRLRFAATAERDRIEFDIDLIAPFENGTRQGDSVLGEALDEDTLRSDLSTGDGSTSEAASPARMETDSEVVPPDDEIAPGGYSQIPLAKRQPDQSLQPRPASAGGAAATDHIDSRVPNAVHQSVTETTSASGTNKGTGTETHSDILIGSPTDNLDNASKSKTQTDPPVAPEFDPDPVIDPVDLPQSSWPQPPLCREQKGIAARAPDAQSNGESVANPFGWRWVGVIAILLVLPGIAVTVWLWPRGPEPEVIAPPTPPSVIPAPSGPEPVLRKPVVPQQGTMQSEDGTRPLVSDNAHKQLRGYFERPAEGGINCAQTPNHSDCPSPKDGVQQPGTATTQQQLKEFFR